MKSFFLILLLIKSFSVFAQVDPDLLSTETQKRFERVPEFEFIIQEAKAMGIKVYLFGGTASAFAHYVRWDLEREAGDTKYQKERFDYDFTNIYRGNQDLDIVIDGTSQQARALAKTLQSKYPHFVGNRQAWEVRLLREKVGDKSALLEDQDFKNQHSDTNSIGVLTLNPSNKEELIYRDLRDWDNPLSAFLEDTSQAKIQYLFSPLHETTKRYKEDMNPPLLSAIRYIAKLTQYEVSGSKEDLELVTKIIKKTNFSALSSYSRKKAEEFTLKALLNSPDIEYAWNLLDKTGLRKEMIGLNKGFEKTTNTLAWWLSKEPLRSFKIGTIGRTAQEIFEEDEIIIAHETNSFQAYENITRSTHGGANVFISRQGASGEAAAYGDGFYTQLGQKGARGSGLTIRFLLDPSAKEGHDFVLGNGNQYIVVKNKSAIKLIPEDISMNLLDFFTLLIKGGLNSDDKGLIEKLNRKFSRYEANFEEMKVIYNSFSKKELTSEVLTPFWFAQSVSQKFPDVLDEVKIDKLTPELISALGPHEDWRKYFLKRFDTLEMYSSTPPTIFNTASETLLTFIQHFLSKEEFYDSPEFIVPLLRDNKTQYITHIIRYVLSQPEWQNYPKLLRLAFNNGVNSNDQRIFYNLAKHVFSKPHWQSQKDIFLQMMDQHLEYTTLNAIAQHSFSQPSWNEHPEVYEAFFKRALSLKDDLELQISTIFSQEHMTAFPELLTYVIEESSRHFNEEVIASVFSPKHWKKHPETLQNLWEKGKSVQQKAIVSKVLSQPYWMDQTELLEKALEEFPALLAEHVISQEHFKNVGFIKKVLNQTSAHQSFIEHVLSQKRWKNIEWLTLLLKSSTQNHPLLAQYVFSQKHWDDQEELLLKIVDEGHADKEIVQYVLTEPHWEDHPLTLKILNIFIEEKRASNEIITYILSQKKWFDLEWIEALQEQNLKLMLEHVFSQPHFEDQDKFLFDAAQNSIYHKLILEIIFTKYKSDKHKYIVEYIIENNVLDEKVIQYLSESPEWLNNHPDLIVNIIRDGMNDPELQEYIFTNEAWIKNPVLIEYLDGEKVKLNNLRLKNKETPFSDWLKSKRRGFEPTDLRCSLMLSN